MDSYQAQILMTISCCIDDMSPELLPPVLDSLLANGAKDAFLSPIIMKKGRPGVKLEVLCEESKKDELIRLIFTETSTLGVKIGEVTRIELERREAVLDLKGESIRVKLAYLADQTLANVKPEFEDCLKASRKLGIPLKEIMQLVSKASNF